MVFKVFFKCRYLVLSFFFSHYSLIPRSNCQYSTDITIVLGMNRIDMIQDIHKDSVAYI